LNGLPGLHFDASDGVDRIPAFVAVKTIKK